MKKVFLIFTMAIIFIVILFARIDFAENLTPEEADYAMQCIEDEFFNANAEAGEYGYAPKENYSRVTILVTPELSAKLAEKGLYFAYYYGDDGMRYLGVQKGSEQHADTSDIYPIMLDDKSSDNTSMSFSSSDYVFANGTEMDIEAPIVKRDYVVLNEEEMSKKPKGYAFSAWYYTSTDSSEVKMTDSSGNNVGESRKPTDANKANVVNQWTQPGSDISVTKDDCEQLSDGRYRYAFTVDSEGTWKVPSGIPTGDWIYKGEGAQAGSPASNNGLDEEGNIGTQSYENYILVPGQTYYIYYSEDDFADGNNPTITYSYLHGGKEINTLGENYDEDVKSKTAFEEIEGVMADFVMLLAKVLNWSISKAFGRNLTIDNIVFIDGEGIDFEDVKIDFFSKNIDGETITSKSPIVKALKPGVNQWYNIFRGIAIAGYMVILVYIGVKILLASTTAEKKATYKDTFMYWVTGIIVLFFMPYFMKYSILLNEAFVTYISDMRSEEAKNGAANSSKIVDDKTTYLNADFDVITFNGEDYMSRVGKIANTKHKLGFSLAYLIMTWQLVLMIVYYYKRVFVTAFLIIIFPMVALTYVWDKLNDGESQALSAWMHEYAIGVFVQTFHAIIFVFVTNTIYATLDNSTGSVDFILLMIAASFMFTGEDIMRQIFNNGQRSFAYGNVAQNAGAIAMVGTTLIPQAAKVATSGVKVIAGKNGIIRAPIRFGRELYKNHKISKNFENLATQQERNARVSALLPSDPNIAITGSMRNAAEAVETLNNPNKHDSEEIANAMDSLDKLKGEIAGRDDQEAQAIGSILNNSKFSDEQMSILRRGMVSAAVMARNGAPRKKIMQTIKMEVDVAFPPGKDEESKRLNKKVLKAVLINLKKNGASQGRTRDDIESAWNDSAKQIDTFRGSVKFSDGTEEKVDQTEVRGRISRRAGKIEEHLKRTVKNYDTLSTSQKSKISSFARSLAKASEASSGIFDGVNLQELQDAKKEITDMMQDSDFEFARDAFETTLKKNVNLQLVSRVIANGGRISRKDAVTENRKAGLLDQYVRAQGGEIVEEVVEREVGGEKVEVIERHIKIDGKQISAEEQKIIEETAEDIAKLEQIGSGVYTERDAYEAITNLEKKISSEKSKEAEALLKLSNLEADIDRYKYLLAKQMSTSDTSKWTFGTKKQRDEVESWAKQTVQRMEEEAFQSKINSDPVVMIYDIIAAANGGGGLSSTQKDIKGLDQLANNRAYSSDYASRIIDAKWSTARSQNQQERIKVQEFATEALKDFEDEEPVDREEATYDGYTIKEIGKLNRINFVKEVTGTAKEFTTAVTGFTAGVVGATVGMAFTDDGAPWGEAVTGATAAMAATGKLNDAIYKPADKLGSKLKGKVEKRLKGYDDYRENEILKARKAFEDKQYETRNEKEKELRINVATAKMFLSSNGELHATVFVVAENAEFIAINDKPGFTWQPYQEQIDFVFGDNNPKNSHDLYIYVKDDSGNIKSYIIKDIKI